MLNSGGEELGELQLLLDGEPLAAGLMFVPTATDPETVLQLLLSEFV